jgi:formamidopyrimidine-DNA glycosylase
MPELPEVETTRRGLLKAVKGARIERVDLHRDNLRSPFPKKFAQSLTERRITNIRRRAKYLLIDLDNGDILLAHLGMSGSFVVMDEDHAPRKHDHVILHLDSGAQMVFNDPRRFGMMDIIKKGGEGVHPLLAHLGPEPLLAEFSEKYLAGELRRRNGPVKPALMDQKLVVGVGNIYASESLFHAGVHPETPARDTAKKAAKIIDCIRTTLKAAIASGGSSLRNYVGAGNQAGYFQHRFYVYGRAGKPCYDCGTAIETTTQAGRATFWCPQCQRKPATRQKS